MSSSRLKPLPRQAARSIPQRQKDLSGTIMTNIIEKLTKDPDFKHKSALKYAVSDTC